MSCEEFAAEVYFESLIYIASDITSDDLTMDATSWQLNPQGVF